MCHEPLSEYTIFGLPLLATNVLKLRKNSSVSKVGSKSKYMPRVRLHEYKAKYDFLNDFRVVRYLIGPAKSTPITSNEVFPWVLVVGRLPGGGVEYAFALTRLHRSNGYEYASPTFSVWESSNCFGRGSSLRHPPWRVSEFEFSTSFSVKLLLSDRYTG